MTRDYVGLDTGEKMRSLGESEERGMDQDQDERCEKETDGGAEPARVRRRETARPRRDPDSNIVLGIGLPSTSLSEPARFGAIGHEIHATGRDCFLSFFNQRRSDLRSFTWCRESLRSCIDKKRYAIVRATITGVATRDKSETGPLVTTRGKLAGKSIE